MNHASKKKITASHSALLFLTLSMVVFGTIGLFRRAIPLPSEVLAFGRGVLGGVFLLLFQRVRGGRFAWGQIGAKNFGLLVLTGVLIGFNWILLFEAYNYTSVAVATLCYYMQPVIVMVLSPLVLKEALKKKQILCVALSLLGMVLVSGILGNTASSGTSHQTGVLLGLGAAALYASVVLLNKRILGVPVYEKTIMQLFSAAAVMIPYMAVSGTLTTYALTGAQIGLFLTVGIVHTGIAYALYFGSIEKLPAKSCALLSYIDPVSAVLLSALFLHEPMGPMGIVGTILIISASIWGEM